MTLKLVDISFWKEIYIINYRRTFSLQTKTSLCLTVKELLVFFGTRNYFHTRKLSIDALRRTRSWPMSVWGCTLIYWIQGPIKLLLSIPQSGKDEYLVWKTYYCYYSNNFIYGTIILLHKFIYQNLYFLFKIRAWMFI